MRCGWGVWLLVALLGAGCAATTVKRNPGPRDRGFRFNRPKPYVLIEQLFDKEGPKRGYYKLSIAYLPDFSEEYSLHIRAGVGINKTAATFKDGWNLTNLTVDVDSQTSQNVEAVATLLKSVHGFTKTGGRDTADDIIIEGVNVPIGYYEPVVSGSRQGRRLFGWRYIGLMPYHACPVEMSGMDCTPCHGNEVYALIVEKNVMVFRRIDQAGRPLEAHKDPADVTAEEVAERFESIRADVLDIIQEKLRAKIEAADITAELQGTRVVIHIRVPATLAISQEAQAELTHLFRDVFRPDLVLGGLDPVVAFRKE